MNRRLVLRAGDDFFDQPQFTILGLDVNWSFSAGNPLSTNDVTDQVFWEAPAGPQRVTVTCTHRYFPTLSRTAYIDVVRLNEAILVMEATPQPPPWDGLHAMPEIMPTLRLIVDAEAGSGTRAYFSGGILSETFYLPGTEGPCAPDGRQPATRKPYATELWPEWWPGITRSYEVIEQRCTEYRSSTFDRKYDYVRQPVQTGAWSFMPMQGPGSLRYVARATLHSGMNYQQSKSSPDEENALRLSLRNLNVTAGLPRRATGWLGLPYEWGGDWFGGHSSPSQFVGGSSVYDGYGVDCSGFVLAVAWQEGRDWGNLDRSTDGIASSTLVIPWDDVAPGDLLVNPGHHVVMVTAVSGSYVDIIEAAGSPLHLVRVDSDTKGERARRGYVPRRIPN